MTSSNARREPRVDIALPVTLQLPGGATEYETKDASYRGVFVVCDEPLQLRKLVRLQTRIPGEEEPVQMLGLVAHTISMAEAQEEQRAPGMGIQLYSVGKQTRERWRDFIRQEYEKRPQAREQVRRMENPSVRVHMKSMEQLTGFLENDLPRGHIFVRTSELQPVGAEILCEIFHPETGDSFDLVCEVIEVVEAPRRERGVRIQFSELTEEVVENLYRFVTGEELQAEEADLEELEDLDEEL